ncbi:MAG TPA: hypothetical protein PKU78_01460 [Candidatus Dojkabacteria bacterium]|nr:hypothetical protein [Candidatus Dojkabacteria bacterium]HRO64868.1 hypothetical protein [Candidatus Dojkabacteria bacterium]HRP36784.1 hypothetical protein [Candidatus Dojkabacteria bacterium]HRP51776.1 hypothetical protein [Candidatus Dojkabacteria bacterium]
MSSNQNISRRIEQIFPVLLFLILATLVMFFISNKKFKIEGTQQVEPTVAIPTIVEEELLCNVEQIETTLASIESELPTYEELISIEGECNLDDYEGNVLRLNIKEAYTYLTFALEKDLPILGWENITSVDVSNEDTSRTQITANRPGKNIQILVSSNDITSDGETSITYYIYNE